MKRFFLLFFFITLISITASSQRRIRTNFYNKGYWGKWEDNNSKVLNGTFDEFIIYDNNVHPSAYIFKVKIYGMSIEKDKKELKKRIKSKQWYDYSGTIEYFTIPYSGDISYDTWLTFSDALFSNSKATDSNVHSNIESAKIMIEPYKKNPKVYNIYFKGMGIAFELR